MISPPLETIRLSETAKANLRVMKRRTGLNNWNVLCRWALCASLADDTSIVDVPLGELSNVEMTWATFGGQHAEVYAALIYARCYQDRLGTERETVANQFRLHLERGLLKLRGRDDTRNLEGLLSLIEESAA